ncbi:HET-domain-containing protein [Plenodomus tracheiphilus IPT5]|uniref:HET-domain-containing protein n=1 Tax=Plenodomus tracheiphilus IPT5 TaxID=1408161 RepID=A0A6A7AUZ2_9PLEO|nr:HET-domain-containing protein [Plenodomus tracheiphilus IPT5]
MDSQVTSANIYGACVLHLGTTSTNIRLIKILPKTSADENTLISCNLHVVSLDKRPDYTALSYVWGDATVNETILLDGERFLVRLNLWNFLVQRHIEGTPGLLWIDALCIDQSSISERNHQVAMMSQIYSKAALVITWLGPGPTELIEALRCIKDSEHPSHEVSILSANVYWHRVWILQELFLGQKVDLICGNESLDLDVLYKRLEDLTEEPDDLEFSDKPPLQQQSRMVSIVVFRENRKANSIGDLEDSAWTLQSILMMFADAQCSDVRDRVYAMTALVVDPLLPDYSLTPSELYEKLVSKYDRPVRHPGSIDHREAELLLFLGFIKDQLIPEEVSIT